MSGNQGAFQLNGSNRPQASMSPPANGSRPAGSAAAQPHLLPALLRAGIPTGLVKGPSVEISDVSRDLLTIDDMRNELVEYAIFRFEKMEARNKYDDEGKPQMPTWDRAIRIRVPGMSTRETARQIQRLNRDTRPLVDKLKTLSPVLQRQIDTAQELLTSQNPDPMNYQWVLAQIDHQLREVDSYVAATGEGDSGRHRKHHGSNRRQYHSRSGGHRKKSYERVSLTAYFKRTPRSNVDITTLYESKKKLSFAENNHNARSGTGQDPRTLPASPKPQGGGVPLGPNGARNSVPSTTVRPSQLGPGGGDNMVRNVTPGNRQNREETRNHNEGIKDLGYSDGSSSDGSFDTQATPTTSISSGSFKDRRQGPSGDWVHIGNGNEKRVDNEQGRDPPRNQTTHEHQYSPKNEPRLSFIPGRHPPPLLRPSDIDMDRVRDDAYLAGIRDGRGDAWLAQQRAMQEAQRLRPRPRPRIIQEARLPTPSYRRHMGHLDLEAFGRREHFDDETSRFNRLSLDDEEGHDGVFRRADARRRREFEYLLHPRSMLGDDRPTSILDDDPFNKATISYAREGRRRYENPYVMDDSESDFSPSPRGDGSFRY